jgi:hypothetical protein
MTKGNANRNQYVQKKSKTKKNEYCNVGTAANCGLARKGRRRRKEEKWVVVVAVLLFSSR